eukprot:TRINITY_DN3920_c0_g2_i1.p1 TRINITY_DN3920_c0_g2~~TRINITY_DN3920_c0_g2_i1.p1  ORF type:complete len:636 (+),score=216.92 TRINITY_DN3920_c0_g2_i1:62-1909(+)
MCVALSMAITVNVAVTSQTKTNGHPSFGAAGGINTGYALDGIEGATITVSPGTLIVFDTTALTALHPIYITSDSEGGRDGKDAITEGVAVEGGGGIESAFGGNNLNFTVPAGANTYYYHCVYHRFMGFKIEVVEATLCEKYQGDATQTDFMIGAITAIFGGLTDADDEFGAFTVEYFDGTTPEGSTDFTTDATALTKLAGDLVAFFGAALGCNEPDFPTYTGSTDMRAVHENMAVLPRAFDGFVNSIHKTLLAAGFSADDAGAVQSLLAGSNFKRAICTEAGCDSSICDFYTSALGLSDNSALVTDVVTKVVGKIVDDSSPIKIYFDGTKGTDFLTDTDAYNALAGKLVAFFGAALGCTDGSVPAYTGTDAEFEQTHQDLTISSSEAAFFNSAVVAVLNEAGASSQDQAIVASVLKSLDDVVITQATAPPPPTIEQTFQVTVSAKTADHAFADDGGFPSAFAFDGAPADGKTIDLLVGKNYKFVNSAGCIHPFYFTTSKAGAGDSEVAVGVDSLDYSQVCQKDGVNGEFVISVTQQLVDATSTFYYNCRVHAFMGGVVRFCPATGCTATGGPSPAPTPTPAPTAGSGTNSATSPAGRAVASFACLVLAAIVALLF